MSLRAGAQTIQYPSLSIVSRCPCLRQHVLDSRRMCLTTSSDDNVLPIHGSPRERRTKWPASSVHLAYCPWLRRCSTHSPPDHPCHDRFLQGGKATKEGNVGSPGLRIQYCAARPQPRCARRALEELARAAARIGQARAAVALHQVLGARFLWRAVRPRMATCWRRSKKRCCSCTGANHAAEIAGRADAASAETDLASALDQRGRKRWRPGTTRRLRRRPSSLPPAAADAYAASGPPSTRKAGARQASNSTANETKIC